MLVSTQPSICIMAPAKETPTTPLTVFNCLIWGLWVRVKVLGSACNNRFPNNNHKINHNSNANLILNPKLNPKLALTLTLTVTITLTVILTLCQILTLTQTIIINYNPPNESLKRPMPGVTVWVCIWFECVSGWNKVSEQSV